MTEVAGAGTAVPVPSSWRGGAVGCRGTVRSEGSQNFHDVITTERATCSITLSGPDARRRRCIQCIDGLARAQCWYDCDLSEHVLLVHGGLVAYVTLF